MHRPALRSTFAGTIAELDPADTVRSVPSSEKSYRQFDPLWQGRLPNGVNNSSGMEWTGFGLSCRLRYPTDNAARIAVLRGIISVVMPAGPVVYAARAHKSGRMAVQISSLTLTFQKPVKYRRAQPIVGVVGKISGPYWKVRLTIAAPFLTSKSGDTSSSVIRQVADSNAVEFLDRSNWPLQTTTSGAGLYSPLAHHYTFIVSCGLAERKWSLQH